MNKFKTSSTYGKFGIMGEDRSKKDMVSWIASDYDKFTNGGLDYYIEEISKLASDSNYVIHPFIRMLERLVCNFDRLNINILPLVSDVVHTDWFTSTYYYDCVPYPRLSYATWLGCELNPESVRDKNTISKPHLKLIYIFIGEKN